VRITNVRQSNRILQLNSNQVNIAAVGGSASVTCSPTNGNNTATGAVAIAANVNFCAPTATGGAATAVNTGAINQTGRNTATATNTSQ
jgi:hypothetical protein